MTPPTPSLHSRSLSLDQVLIPTVSRLISAHSPSPDYHIRRLSPLWVQLPHPSAPPTAFLLCMTWLQLTAVGPNQRITAQTDDNPRSCCLPRLPSSPSIIHLGIMHIVDAQGSCQHGFQPASILPNELRSEIGYTKARASLGEEPSPSMSRQ